MVPDGSEEIGGSCEEMSDGAAGTCIEDDGSRDQIRDIKGSEETEDTEASETNEEMGTENAYWVQEERQRRARPVWICSSREMQGGAE